MGKHVQNFNAGATAAHKFDSSILVAVHFANPEKGNYPTYAKNLDTYGVDYDVFLYCTKQQSGGSGNIGMQTVTEPCS